VTVGHLLAAINALRHRGKDLHDEARWEKAGGRDKDSDDLRAEAEHLYDAARELEDETHRAVSEEQDKVPKP